MIIQSKLLRPAIIFLFGVALVVSLSVLFYEGKHLITKINLVRPDRISVLYLQLLININPDNAPLHLSLAKQYRKLGNLEKASDTLQSLIKQQGRDALEARVLNLELNLESYFRKKAIDSFRASDLPDLKKNIESIANESLPVNLLPRVVKLSLELERPDLAAKLYESWASLDGPHRFERFKEAGRWYIAAGQAEKAAAIYQKIYDSPPDASRDKQFALLTIEAYLAADKGGKASVLVQGYLQKHPDDKEMLERAVTLSLANNNPKEALAWGRKRLALDPANPEQINKLIDIALAAEAGEEAWLLSERLLKFNPEDISVRERTAQLAEWARHPDAALNHWIWLIKRDKHNQKAIENGLRLAQGLKARQTAIELFTLLSEVRALTETELNYLLAIFNPHRDFTQVISFLQHYLARYPATLAGWKALAEAQENAGRLTEAAASWHQIGQRFDIPVVAAVREAGLLRRNGAAEAAFTVLLQNQDKAANDDAEFWQSFADLSWETKRADQALLAYTTLWKSGAADSVTAERLIQLHRDRKNPEAAIAVAKEAYQRFGHPRWLLLAMDTAAQFGMWNYLKQILANADADQHPFRSLEMYWLMRAQLHNHDGQYPTAMTDYQQVLKLNPGSTTAKEGMLWALIDHGDKQNLARYLAFWQKEAAATPSLWGVYGIGLSKLGKNEQALTWFDRKLRKGGDDPAALLAYVDALAKSGRVDAAIYLRQHVLSKLKAQLHSSIN
jgi:tetratricopeptide (TPR) repeat protein